MVPLVERTQCVGRFAPSPTGRLHAGNIFSYLVSWIVAKRSSGTVLLRIDDLDPSRSRKEYADQAMRDLEALGLSWDGEAVYQSKRTDLYRAAFDELSSEIETYPCFCTRADLAAASAPHEGEAPVYPGSCRNLPKTECDERIAALAKEGRSPSVRVAVPDMQITFDDLFQGQTSLSLVRDCGDFVVRRSDGVYAYQLAVVVDDAAMGITSVVRGCDLLGVTPIQIFLQRILHAPTPDYAHVPLLRAPDGRRIAKRDADASLDELLSVYGSHAGVLGHIAFVAGLVEEDRPFLTDELLKHANLTVLENVHSLAWR